MTQPLDIVYCKDCKYYRCKYINEYSSIHNCLKNNDVQISNPSLYCNKPCFAKSKAKIKAQKKKS